MKKIRLSAILSTAVFLFIGVSQIAMPGISFACSSDNPGSAKSQVLNGVGETGVSCNGGDITSLASTIVSIISLIAGIIAVIMIIVSGIKFMTSSGDPQKVGSAKNSLLYAIIGLVVAALAQAIIHFVLNKSNSIL